MKVLQMVDKEILKICIELFFDRRKSKIMTFDYQQRKFLEVLTTNLPNPQHPKHRCFLDILDDPAILTAEYGSLREGFTV